MARKRKSVIFGFGKPDFTLLTRDNKNFARECWAANEFIRYEIKAKARKKETIKWAKANNKNFKALETLEEWRFAIIGKHCYILNRKGEVPENVESWMVEKFSEMTALGETRLIEIKKEAEDKPVKRKSIQDYLYDKAAQVCGEEFESIVDEFITSPKTFKANNYDPLSLMRKNEITQGHARYIVKFYDPLYKQIRDNIENYSNKEIKEYFGHLTLPQLKQLSRFYEKIIDSAKIIIDTAKAKRKPRKKKAADPSKLVEKLKYLKEDNTVGLASVNPVTILGAKEVWFYNSKLRKLGRYVALDKTGLDVKGMSIVNFSTDKSCQKTLRKPESQIRPFKSGGIRKFNKHFGDIKAVDTKIKGRLNDHIVIFKVFK